MARPRNDAAHVTSVVEDLLRSVTQLLDSVGTAVRSGDRGDTGGGSKDGGGRKPRGPGKGNPAHKAKLKAHWANLTPAARKARIAKMHAWRKKA